MLHGALMTKETVGEVSSKLIQKEPETRSPIEQMRENLTDYENHFYLCLEDGKKKYPKDFFIVVLTKKERLMQNVIRNYFLSTSACPTPTYDQAVYHYDRLSESFEFLWVIPSKDTCELFRESALQIHPEEQELLKCVLDYYDGTLLKMAKKFNNEKIDSPLLDKH